MKVPNLITSSVLMRGLALVSLTVALAAGAAAPVAAVAESAPAVVTTSPSLPATSTSSVEGTIALATVGATVTPLPVARKLTVREIVAKVGRDAGLSKSEVDALLWIAKRESNFHPTSHSRSECHGLFQLSAGMAHGHPWKDPVWNTKRAIKYMRGRYGGVAKAKAFWLSHHWY